MKTSPLRSILSLAMSAFIAGQSNADTYSKGISLNVANGLAAGDGGVSHTATGPASPYSSFAYWNNIDAGGASLDGSTLDSTGAPVVGLTASFAGIDWVLPEINGYGGKHGTPDPGTLGYIGLGTADIYNFGNYNTLTMTITGIPFGSFDVAVYNGWFENGVQWNLLTTDAPSTTDGILSTFGNTLSANFSTPGSVTLTIGSGGGGGIYAVQILEKGGAALTPYQIWAAAKIASPGDRGQGLDPDGDGVTNLLEFAFNGYPVNGNDLGKLFVQTADSDGNPNSELDLVLTVAVRSGTPAFTGSPSPTATHDGIVYTIEGKDDLAFPGGAVSPVTVIPPLVPAGAGYEYRSFALISSNGLDLKGFLRARVTAAP